MTLYEGCISDFSIICRTLPWYGCTRLLHRQPRSTPSAWRSEYPVFNITLLLYFIAKVSQSSSCIKWMPTLKSYTGLCYVPGVGDHHRTWVIHTCEADNTWKVSNMRFLLSPSSCFSHVFVDQTWNRIWGASCFDLLQVSRHWNKDRRRGSYHWNWLWGRLY